MKLELLSPVGNKEMLYQAIHNGADAVYLSGEFYGARKFAKNFTKEELKEAVEYSHLYGVLVYVTVNTIIYEEEVEECFNYIKYLYEIGVDALIMQDVGMIDLVHQKIPDFPIHASTQMHNYRKESIKFLKKLGVQRVVFARETSIDDLKDIKDIETEVFIHGALCISYSGCCLFSSLVGGRSGNRGECAGSCRLQYELLKGEKEISKDYILSTKELSSIDSIENILDKNITSLKIEGRMKSPEYVGFVTRLYRKIIDAYKQGKKYKITKEDRKNLLLLYNREFTKGFINNENKENIVNTKSPKHMGIPLGEVEEVSKKIKIKLTEDLNQGDGIRFTENDKGLICNYIYNEKGNLISKAKKGDIVYLKNTDLITKPCLVLKTLDKKLKERLEKIEEKKIEINWEVKISNNNPIKLILSDDTNTITKEFGIAELAKTKETTKEEIKEKLEKLGNTPFICKNINIKREPNTFIPMSLLNQTRRELVEKLIEKRKQVNRKLKLKEYIPNKPKEINKEDISYSFLTRTKEQIETCIEENVSRIYINDRLLYNEYKDKYNNIYYYEDRVSNLKSNEEKIVVSDPTSMEVYKDKKLIGSCYMNVVNSYHVNYLEKYLNTITLSIECNINQTKDLIKGYISKYNNLPNIEKVIYGRPDLMIMKYCPLTHLKEGKICNVCKDKYFLKDRKDAIYPIIQKNCLTTILHYKNIDERDNINEYIKLGINNYLCILYNETGEETKKIIKSIIK